MNKNTQQLLVSWLNSQSSIVKYLLRLSTILGLIIGFIIICQAWILAHLLQALIIDQHHRSSLLGWFIVLAALFVLRGLVFYYRERVGFLAGSRLRRNIRAKVLDMLERLGPAWIQGRPAGSWSSMLLEQIEHLHDFYAHYLPQMYLAVLVPILILIVIFFINWIACLILFFTAPLIVLFMVLIGTGAAEANRRNFIALARLSGDFLDLLRGLDTIRLFFCAEMVIAKIRSATNEFRQRTMEVLRLAFLSSGVLEFFSSLSIAIVAILFGFSYLGELNFGSYHTGVTLFAGFLVLILAPEYFQTLRDLGNFYHAKAQAIAAAESLVSFLEYSDNHDHGTGSTAPLLSDSIHIFAQDLFILAPDGSELAGPLNFTIAPGERVAIVGVNGAGKSSVFHLLLCFLPYRGSLQVNGMELRTIAPKQWRERISWINQNPVLPASTLRENILLGAPNMVDELCLKQAIDHAYVNEFINKLPEGLDSIVGEDGYLLSVGQVQRVALARALIRTPALLLLDEPTASLDANSERLVMQALDKLSCRQTTLLITHQFNGISEFDTVWVMGNGKILQQGHYPDLAAVPGPLADLIAFQDL